MSIDSSWLVRPLDRSDRERWTILFRGYAEFYERTLSEEQIETVWQWIFEESRMLAYVVTPSGEPDFPVGLAHLRTWIRPLRASVNGYLDDLFVEVAYRGSGAVDALLRALADLAESSGWSIIRWTTASDNVRAQTVYDRYASRTTWVTYDMDSPLEFHE